MNKFSVKILRDKIKLYKSNRDEYKNIIEKYSLYEQDDILCKTILEDEVTLYYYIKKEDEQNKYSHYILSKICLCDTREYTVVNIYEDLPGIDHVGIIYNISRLLLEKNIPILYINTFGHNLVLISEEYINNATEILNKLGNLSYES